MMKGVKKLLGSIMNTTDYKLWWNNKIPVIFLPFLWALWRNSCNVWGSWLVIQNIPLTSTWAWQFWIQNFYIVAFTTLKNVFLKSHSIKLKFVFHYKLILKMWGLKKYEKLTKKYLLWFILHENFGSFPVTWSSTFISPLYTSYPQKQTSFKLRK